ncbi:hypothetical protein L6R52_01645 [Myxococcota bacterium]|nr:hypothetical protein [Myxococcota bacterium]
MSFGPNPFESPQAELGAEHPDAPHGSASADDERIRRELLNHEASLQAVGRLMMLGGGIMALAALALVVGAAATGPGMLGVAAIYVVLAIPGLWIGNLLRKLDPRGRIPAAVLNAIGLLGIPIGTLISAYILYLLLSVKGQRVLSTEYQGIVARTPHIRYKSPILVIVLLAILIAACIAVIAGALA